MITRLLLPMVVVISGCAARDPAIATCDNELEAVHRVPPELPPKLHNDFEGYAVIQFVVDEDGTVDRPNIEAAQWHPIGLSGGEPEGYEEAILAAISKWRYPPRAQPCRAMMTMRIEFEE